MGQEVDVYAAAESAPWDEVVADAFERATRQIADVRSRSPFYADLFDAAGVGPDHRIRDWDDLAKIPTTDKRDIRASLAAAPPLGRHLGVDRTRLVQVQATSGTTGSPSYLGLTEADIATWNELGARAFYAAGFRAGDVVLHAWSLAKGFTGGVPAVRMLAHLGATVVPVGAEAGLHKILTVAKEQEAVAMCTAPNFALYLADKCAETIGVPATELAVTKLVVGGEPGGGIPAIRARIQDGWGATCCEVLGNSDIATIVWAECPERDGMHFIGQGLVLPEIVDPVTGRHVEPVAGATGELLYTALQREASALIRFRSGDLVQITDTGCACGRTSYKLRCDGRTDDMLLVRGINVWPTAVQGVVADFAPRATGAMRIVLDFPGHVTNDNLVVKVEHAPGLPAGAHGELARDISAAIRSRLSFRADVRIVPAGELEPPGAAKVRLVERSI
ncbi:AMP-binding protein [Actinomadura sp. 7K534]|uniref:phenylacetate--CoA ligase family protein n=1 Tax=Actinomadura sp. 7K534 TaxID=2530366 RepID=UPI00104D0BA6|nr:AMP-binding protein [Actinomadura sp. 7K534]TDB95464.1 phenylacetate--CoA ligase family protein [Actinomadura sp. 7K534]